MKKVWMLASLAGALMAGACRDAVGPEGNASLEDRQAILTAIDEAGYSEEVTEGDGYAENYAVAAYADAVYAAGAEPAADVTLPRYWFRKLGPVVSRTRTVNVQNDSATVEMTTVLDGRLLALIFNATVPDTFNKLFRHTVIQKAVLVKEAAAGGRRDWRLVQISPQQWIMTDAAKQTIALNQVTITVNGQVKIDVTDPATLYDVNNRIPRLVRGDVVSVSAKLTNSVTGNTPPEFVFLHLFHADPLGLFWRRVPMERQPDGSYLRTWTVRLGGRARIVVDAIDSQTFTSAGEYRANVWGIPYRIEN